MAQCNHDTDELDDYQLELLKKLIAFQSVNPPGNEKPAAEFVARQLEDLGFAVALHEIAPNRANVVARLEGEKGPEIALCGHLDVVAAIPEQWSHPPFTLHDHGDRLYGRGVSDMKGAISSMIGAARDLILTGRNFKGTLTLLFVADEEDSTLGTKQYVASGAKPDAVIIGEPTEMNICIAHRGVARYHVYVSGRSGHASRPDEAKNPITTAARLIEEVERHNRVLSGRTHPILPPPSMAVTMIEAAEQPNMIPGRCRLTIDRRTLPGEDKDVLQGELAALRQNLSPEDASAVGDARFFVFTQAGHTLPDSHFAGQCKQVLDQLGVQACIRDFPAGCDQFAFIGAGIDCLLVGPGNIAQAHTVDEFIVKSQLSLARSFYREFIRERLQWKTI